MENLKEAKSIIDDLNKNFIDLNDTIDDLETEINILQTEINKLQDELDDKECEADSFREEIRQYKSIYHLVEDIQVNRFEVDNSLDKQAYIRILNNILKLV